MLTTEQINQVHHLHWAERWSVRKIARQLHLCRKTIAKYLAQPVQTPAPRPRSSKLDTFKPTIAEWLEQDPTVSAEVSRLRLFNSSLQKGFL